MAELPSLINLEVALGAMLRPYCRETAELHEVCSQVRTLFTSDSDLVVVLVALMVMRWCDSGATCIMHARSFPF